MAQFEIHNEKVVKAIQDLIALVAETHGDNLDRELVIQIIQTSLKLYIEKHDTGQLKLMTRALKEMRYAYRIFNQYTGVKRISIFGSARTPETHIDYGAAKAFSSLMALQGWMCITGGANGIMKAGVEGSEKGSSFGLSIKLPFEVPTNTLIAGDPKSIIFRYFFTRKLMFMSHSDAIAVFPGGFGTMDEIFEVLTLMQTGKTPLLPIVLLEGENGKYWDHWEEYIHKQLLTNGWISEEDLNLYYKAPTINKAVEHINKFYRRYHSQRYVKDHLVIRMKDSLTADQVSQLNQQFSELVKSGEMNLHPPFEEETDFLNLPRLTFVHNRQNFGLLRALIDQINSF
jgi:uncharacterized protein (TIGR00730 family)